MYRAFLDMCTGTLAEGQLTVYAPDDITKGRLDNDRVRGVLCEAGGEGRRWGRPIGIPCGGGPPKTSPQEILKNLVRFGSQFDNIENQIISKQKGEQRSWVTVHVVDSPTAGSSGAARQAGDAAEDQQMQERMNAAQEAVEEQTLQPVSAVAS